MPRNKIMTRLIRGKTYPTSFVANTVKGLQHNTKWTVIKTSMYAALTCGLTSVSYTHLDVYKRQTLTV